jgi:hypothetical protein
LIRRGNFLGWVYLLALITVFAATIFGIVVTGRNGPPQQRSRVVSTEARLSLVPSQLEGLPAPHFGSVAASHRLFPYSVIPGGVASAQELRNALAHDPIAAAHYADFDLNKTRVIQLESDQQVYVSYRLNDHIYWTNKRLTLSKGESVITDGKNEARTRCGNRLSDVAVAPTSAKQPADMTLDPLSLPEITADRPAVFPFFLPFPAGPSSSGPGSEAAASPPFFPIAGGSSSHPGSTDAPPTTPPTSSTTPPVATPEPGTLAMTTAGIWMVFASGWLAFFRRKFASDPQRVRGVPFGVEGYFREVYF